MKNRGLLVMDYQYDILKGVEEKTPALLKNTQALLSAARESGVPVIFVKVAFRSGYPEVSEKNKAFKGIKDAGKLLLENPGSDIHSDVSPLADEPVVIKHRFGPFQGTDLLTILRAKNVDNLILAGVSTSGVVLSSVRFTADLDFGINIVSDACADPDDEVHGVLMGKVFPRQATVLTTAEAVKILA